MVRRGRGTGCSSFLLDKLDEDPQIIERRILVSGRQIRASSLPSQFHSTDLWSLTEDRGTPSLRKPCRVLLDRAAIVRER